MEKHHKVGGLNNTKKIIVSQLWRLEVWDQGANRRVSSFWGLFPLYHASFSASGGFLTILGILGL